MTNSMTAFSRHQESHDWGQQTWEIRSVNHRYLEPSFKLPDLARPCETELRKQLKKYASRGKLDISLRLQPDRSTDSLEINQAMLSSLLKASSELKLQMPEAAAVSPLDLLAWPGIIQEKNSELAPILPDLLQGFAACPSR